MCGLSWRGPKGKFTVLMTQPTGPLAGELTGKLELEIQ